MNMSINELKDLKSYLDGRWNGNCSPIERENLLPNLIWVSKEINKRYEVPVCKWCGANFERVFTSQEFCSIDCEECADGWEGK